MIFFRYNVDHYQTAQSNKHKNDDKNSSSLKTVTESPRMVKAEPG